MARRYIIAGASVGLSALLAAMLLGAPQPALQPQNQATKPMAVPKQTAVEKTEPKTVSLPAPPRPRVTAPTVPAVSPVPSAPPIQPMTALKPTVIEKPAPAIVQPLKPVAAKSAEQIPQPIEPVAAVAKPVLVTPAKTDTAHGRVLLRLLEHGRGPAIELAWPGDAAERARLYRRFRECFGMRVALRDRTGDLFVAGNPAGQAWHPNNDLYSGFARQPTGRLVPAERDDLNTIARRHGISSYSPAMRIFPRAVDAQLLDGLQQILADGYKKAGAIRARYYLAKGAIQVRDIQVDGHNVAGSILLGNRCRRS
ncbi:MAG: hypothetical protein HOK21_09715 [Rhodospirillaceae bacterium]|jgi:hypothetical protein|nr:hypothetical protein [Rhodospirillaceae bacterium]MBT5082909.1 hypothetical protein [Rhodospirillaceae bacterium]MBT5524353.1 hypothetical protein [Rhodospirillaceae bacterium]MBT5878851.1 hypothetical protein [Rhodospirillaceae bacterium]MBT6590887.1 hypothetical protein [Rhodospirillaceae bacterium]